MPKDQPSYYAIIPASVRYHLKLNQGAKLLYGEISALCDKTGKCWAKNRYFARLYGVENNTISLWIGQLRSLGFIKVSINRGSGNDREIRLSEALPSGDRESYHEKSCEGSHEKSCELEYDKGDRIEEEVRGAWNAVAEFRGCMTMTKARRAALRCRMRDAFFRTNWRAALQRASQSSFLKGQNSRGWVANIDWFLRPGTVTKLMEGFYDNGKKGKAQALSSEEFEREDRRD